MASLVAQMVKNLPAMQKTWVQSLGREDLLEKKMATPSSVLAWRIPWAEEPGGLQSMVWQWVGHDWLTNTRGRRYIHFTPSSLWSCTLTLIWSLLEKVPNMEGKMCPGDTLFKFRIVLKERSHRGCMHACSVASYVSNSVILWTVTHQAPLSMGFCRQEY